MIKAGIIGAGAGLIYVMALTLVSPFCTLCFTPALGFGVGYLASWFDKPLRSETCLVNGTIAGGLTGVGVVAGQIMAAVVNAVLVTNSDALPMLMEEIGLSQLMFTDNAEYWQATMAINSFCGLFNFALVVGLSVMGSMFWFQRHNKNSLAAVSS